MNHYGEFIEHGLVNRFAFIESPVQYPVGRFTYRGPEQDADGIVYMAFDVPSKSKPGKKQYKLLLDPFKMLTNCGCQHRQIHRSTVDLNHLPDSRCWHMRHLALWVKRSANKQKLEDMRLALEHYYGQLKRERSA